MEVKFIEPQGYCNGVKRAINLIKEAINDPTIKRPIYLLGPIIHNKYANLELTNLGVILLDNKTRLDMLDEIESGSVVISAHGVSQNVYQKALDKGLNIIDTTCPYVNLIHKNVLSHLPDYKILYVGTKNHPECEGILDLNKDIILITSPNDLENIDICEDKIYVTCQTTLSHNFVDEIYLKIKDKYPQAIFDEKICSATTQRQNAVINQEKVDLCIVVGDKTSSNSKKLVEVCENKAKIKAYLVENKNDINDDWLIGVNSVSITSGASTPDFITQEVITYLKEK